MVTRNRIESASAFHGVKQQFERAQRGPPDAAAFDRIRIHLAFCTADGNHLLESRRTEVVVELKDDHARDFTFIRFELRYHGHISYHGRDDEVRAARAHVIEHSEDRDVVRAYAELFFCFAQRCRYRICVARLDRSAWEADLAFVVCDLQRSFEHDSPQRFVAADEQDENSRAPWRIAPSFDRGAGASA